MIPVGRDGSVHGQARRAWWRPCPFNRLDRSGSQGEPRGNSYRLLPPRGPNRIALEGSLLTTAGFTGRGSKKAKPRFLPRRPRHGSGCLLPSIRAVFYPRPWLRGESEVIDDGGSSLLLRVGP